MSVGVVRTFNRTLEQELNALLRGASLECLVCGEFVMRIEGAIFCPECRSQLVHGGEGRAALGKTIQIDGR